MHHYSQVTKKLAQFVRKFYINELLKGSILFLAFGLLYFIVVVALEYFLWLSTLGRTILFSLFLIVELTLFFFFIIKPILKLFKLSKGLDYLTASSMIGKHFPQVSDKLTNILQLKDSGASSDLVIASIEQKSKEIQPIPFQLAINFNTNVKYLRYTVIPLSILCLVWVSGKFPVFNESYQRVLDYKTAYEPPAPFQFIIENNPLDVEAGKNFLLSVSIEGEVIPQEAQIFFQGQSYFLKQDKPGHFVYEFENLNEPLSFQLKANEVTSKAYQLSVIEVPKIVDLSLSLSFPSYTQLSSKVVQGTGNAQIPEGTLVNWNIKAQNTETVSLQIKDTLLIFKEVNKTFNQKLHVFSSSSYTISTSNQLRQNYEELQFNFSVIKDEFPQIDLQSKPDSLAMETTYFQGKVSDDYGVNKLQLVYYPEGDVSMAKQENISISKGNFSTFFYVFPNRALVLEDGTSYIYYFEASDNDAINGSKKTKSSFFSYRKRTKDEERDEKLNQQGKTIQGLEKTLQKQQEQKKDLDELNQLEKEKSSLSFSDKKKIENYLQRQEQQRQLMKKYSKELKENLQNFEPENQDLQKEELIERLQQNEERLEKNEELMKELDKYREKLEDENLSEKLKEAANETSKQERTLEQLLELTKRYYVERKAEQLSEQLNKLSEEQESLSEKEETSSQEQDELNKEFESLQKELEQLQKENNDLKKPLDLYRDPFTEKEISQEMQEAKELIEKAQEESKTPDQPKEDSDDTEKSPSKESPSTEEASPTEESEKQDAEKGESSPSSPSQQKQKSAAQKMKELSQKMGLSMSAGGQEQQAEDAEMLQRILQNLIRFSFEQEELMDSFKNIEENKATFASNLRRQAELKENFKHIDDSLFSLALRNQMISESILTKLSDIDYHTDLALDRFADNQLSLAISDQRYVMTYANELANMLDNSLDNMQQQMSSGSGSGSSGKGSSGNQPGDQLSDIIKSHEELQQAMENALGKSPGKGKKGESPGSQNTGDSEGEQQGSSGKEGNQSGKEGSQNGKDGKDGNSGNESQQGNNGTTNGQGDKGNEQGSDGRYNEQMNSELYEIYKKQQMLKQQLEDRIQQLGLEPDARNLQKSIEELENDLLMNGFSSETIKQMKNINHQLLKLKEAAQKQGQESQREAITNTKVFSDKKSNNLEKAKEYFNTIEILNRQQLPLQPKYKELVKQYFNEQNN